MSDFAEKKLQAAETACRDASEVNTVSSVIFSLVFRFRQPRNFSPFRFSTDGSGSSASLPSSSD